MEENFTLEEIQNKVRKYKRRGRISLVTLFGGLGLVLYSVLGTGPSDRTDIINNYKNAKNTVYKLEHKKGYLTDLVKYGVPYENSEVRESLDMISENTKQEITYLDKAIESVKVDISEMENNSEIRKYNKNEKKKKIGGTIAVITGFPMMVYGMISCSRNLGRRKEYEGMSNASDT